MKAKVCFGRPAKCGTTSGYFLQQKIDSGENPVVL